MAEEYFQGLFTSFNTDTLNDVFPDLQKTVTSTMNDFLTRTVTNAEIKQAVFLIGPDRAPAAVLINGTAYGHFQPTRDIRHGDPLSPYLYIICAEVLSQMMTMAEYRKEFHGMKLARKCPTVTHPFFWRMIPIRYFFVKHQQQIASE